MKIILYSIFIIVLLSLISKSFEKRTNKKTKSICNTSCAAHNQGIWGCETHEQWSSCYKKCNKHGIHYCQEVSVKQIV